ncbi:hypothetical protein CY0110_15562 [Crocosphaera chwakensis CCY0110]|uniref:Uncharacterized protein n=1 Tax=Crocosphaera chwakensis CCY0110 TaxID=391612 RepID=A3IHE4_9CHRO|nr:hypothetical protein CY0110_15562 [Crocosphaera chwakensis CCY0110]
MAKEILTKNCRNIQESIFSSNR